MWRWLVTKLSEEEELRRAKQMFAIAAEPPACRTDVTRIAVLLQVWILDVVDITERHMIAKAIVNNVCDAAGLPKQTFTAR